MEKRGGKRAGAGRKKETKPIEKIITRTPLEYLLSVMNDPLNSTARRMRAAVSCLPYCHAKADRNAKLTTQERAKRAGIGKYAPTRGPFKVLTLPLKPEKKED